MAKEREILATAEQAKQTVKEDKKAKTELIYKLKCRKEKLNEMLDIHRWASEYLIHHGENGTDYVAKCKSKAKDLCKELDIPETTTIPEIRLMVKEILAKIRSLKGI